MASINYAVGDKWDSGFIGNVTVPGGSDGLHGWTLEFDASFAISNIWGARIVSHVGNHYVISGLDWTSNVAPGGQASFGFEATTTGSSGTAATGRPSRLTLALITPSRSRKTARVTTWWHSSAASGGRPGNARRRPEMPPDAASRALRRRSE